jgi:hypothetical protein
VSAHPPVRVPLATLLGNADVTGRRLFADPRPPRHRAAGPAVVGGLPNVCLPDALRAARRPGGAEPAGTA